MDSSSSNEDVAKSVPRGRPHAQSISSWIGIGSTTTDGFFLARPDEVKRPTFVGDGVAPRDTDLLDDLQVFVTYRPAWVGKDGFPLSWQHFQYGLAHIARESLRQQLSRAQSGRMARVAKEDWEVYQRDVSMVTEVPRHGR